MTGFTLEKSVRIRAMWCHLSTLSWLVMVTIDLIINLNLSLKQPSATIFWTLVLPCQLILAYVIPVTVWLFLRRTHPFVDLAGKSAINHLLTISVWSITICFLLFSIWLVGCGFLLLTISSYSRPGSTLPNEYQSIVNLFEILGDFFAWIEGFFKVNFILFSLLAIAAIIHLPFSIVAAFQACKEKVHRCFIVFPLLR
jgi:uncharacterized Tic20 family protein